MRETIRNVLVLFLGLIVMIWLASFVLIDLPYGRAARDSWRSFEAVRGPADFDSAAFLTLGIDATADRDAIRRRLDQAGFAIDEENGFWIEASRDYRDDEAKQKGPAFPTFIRPENGAAVTERLSFFLLNERPSVVLYAFNYSYRKQHIDRSVDMETMTVTPGHGDGISLSGSRMHKAPGGSPASAADSEPDPRDARAVFEMERGSVDFESATFLTLGIDANADRDQVRNRLLNAGFTIEEEMPGWSIAVIRRYTDDQPKRSGSAAVSARRPGRKNELSERLTVFFLNNRANVLLYSFTHENTYQSVMRSVDLVTMKVMRDHEAMSLFGSRVPMAPGVQSVPAADEGKTPR